MLPSTKDLKVAAVAFVSEARENPLSALPAAGAAGAAGLVLFAAASTLTAALVAEGVIYKGAGMGGDGIFRLGVPGKSEVLVPGGPFQNNNGYLGMWNREKQVVPGTLTGDQRPEVQARLRAQFDAERKKFDVEAQGQGYASAEVWLPSRRGAFIGATVAAMRDGRLLRHRHAIDATSCSRKPEESPRRNEF